jgi:hypothetical protein
MLSIATQSITRLKDKLRALTKRNRGKSIEEVIREINTIIPGWIRYFKHAQCKGALARIDEWLRRKLRCYRLKQLKRTITIARMLITQGIAERSAWRVAKSGKGWWRLAIAPQIHRAMGVSWWKQNGLKGLVETFESL